MTVCCALLYLMWCCYPFFFLHKHLQINIKEALDFKKRFDLFGILSVVQHCGWIFGSLRRKSLHWCASLSPDFIFLNQTSNKLVFLLLHLGDGNSEQQAWSCSPIGAFERWPSCSSIWLTSVPPQWLHKLLRASCTGVFRKHRTTLCEACRSFCGSVCCFCFADSAHCATTTAAYTHLGQSSAKTAPTHITSPFFLIFFYHIFS